MVSFNGKVELLVDSQLEGSRKLLVDTVEFLGQVDFLKYMDKESLDYLASKMRLLSLPEGPVIRDKDPADGLYIIKSGVAGVTKSKEKGASEAVLAMLSPGKSFGEIGLIDGLPRTANVSAMGPMECYFLDRDTFLAALDEHPEIARGMLRGLATMVRNADQWIAQLLRL